MHGFVNLLVAAALLRAGAIDESGGAARVLDDEDPGSFVVTPEQIGWRDRVIEAAALGSVREEALTAYGSCSFGRADRRPCRAWLAAMSDRDATTDPALRSWVPGADGSDRPIQSLPYCAFALGTDMPRLGVGIGPMIVDLGAVARAGHLDLGTVADPAGTLGASNLNPLLAQDRAAWRRLRARLGELLRSDADDRLLRPHLVSIADAALHLPFAPVTTSTSAARSSTRRRGRNACSGPSRSAPSELALDRSRTMAARARWVVSGTRHRRPGGSGARADELAERRAHADGRHRGSTRVVLRRPTPT